MPMPPAAFSPLATTKSSPSSSRRPGSSALSVRRPAEATMSPMNRIAVTPGEASGRGAHTWGMRASEPDTEADAPPEETATAEEATEARRPRRPARPARRRDRPPAWSRWWCRAGSSSSCCRSRCSARGRSQRAAGPVLLLFIVAGADRAAAEPVRVAAAAGRLPARRRGRGRLPDPRARAHRARHPARRPRRRPGLVLPRQRARHRRRRQRVDRGLPELARPQRHRPPGLQARPDRRPVARRPHRTGLGRDRRLHPRRAGARWWRARSR